jgi:hypothetical protein
VHDSHGGPGGRRAGLVVVLQTGASAGLVTRQADAGAPAAIDVVGGSGTFNEQRACGRALATLAPLRQGQQWILVALRTRALDRDVGLSRRRRGRVLLLGATAGGGRRARRAVLRVPKARGRLSRGSGARGSRVQTAQAEAEDAVRERPALRRCVSFGRSFSRGRVWRRRRRLGGV